jgi:hypothetical protein
MTILTTIAEIIGFAVLGFDALLLIVTAAVTVHDFVRARFPKYDLWLYDDNRRWNRRPHNKRSIAQSGAEGAAIVFRNEDPTASGRQAVRQTR